MVRHGDVRRSVPEAPGYSAQPYMPGIGGNPMQGQPRPGGDMNYPGMPSIGGDHRYRPGQPKRGGDHRYMPTPTRPDDGPQFNIGGPGLKPPAYEKGPINGIPGQGPGAEAPGGGLPGRNTIRKDLPRDKYAHGTGKPTGRMPQPAKGSMYDTNQNIRKTGGGERRRVASRRYSDHKGKTY